MERYPDRHGRWPLALISGLVFALWGVKMSSVGLGRFAGVSIPPFRSVALAASRVVIYSDTDGPCRWALGWISWGKQG